MFFEMTLLLSWSAIIVFSTLFATYNRADQHVVLRRLGVSEGNFWLVNILFTAFPTFTTTLLCSLIWHYTGVLPFAGISLGFTLLEGFVLGAIFTCISSMLSVLLGMSKSAPVLCACVFSYVFLFMPAMFHIGFFQSSSMFDPSIVPQWGTWLSMALCPIFAAFGLMDSMTSGLSVSTRSLTLTDYSWRHMDDLIPVAYLFEDYHKYSSVSMPCMISNSNNGHLI